MSTFDGIVKEFPEIRIDHFRKSSDEQSQPPLAYFLSHVHSDHLTGLESCKSPFIYCSPATREILLRLEKYPHRMNFAKGILESRKQTYRHLRNLLKAIPLETPTVLELSPGRKIRVTLFDANHCVGAVMFLIEGEGKSIIYTGDVRSEAWWVEQMARHPLLVPYMATGGQIPIKRLDMMYLDTTFATKADPYRTFPSKREGLVELLHKVAKYPKETRFYFDSWTFGYEEVWQALSSFLDSPVHLDQYRIGLYRSLAYGKDLRAAEATKLVGFECGNHFQQGCITADQSRLHSCEKGTECPIWGQDFVRITPIISRHNGVDIAELGAGGGQGDLNQQHELEVGDPGMVGQLMSMCVATIQNPSEESSKVLKLLTSILTERKTSLSLEGSGLFDRMSDTVEGGLLDDDDGHIRLDQLIPALARLLDNKQRLVHQHAEAVDPDTTTGCNPLPTNNLPRFIRFPYSRHSSYSELCYLVEVFRPHDLYPCTVDFGNWTTASSMGLLFGHLYASGHAFSHDRTMRSKMEMKSQRARRPPPEGFADRLRDRTPSPEHDDGPHDALPLAQATRPSDCVPPKKRADGTDAHEGNGAKRLRTSAALDPSPPPPPPPSAITFESPHIREDHLSPPPSEPNAADIVTSSALSNEGARLARRREIFETVANPQSLQWSSSQLTSTSGHQDREMEL